MTLTVRACDNGAEASQSAVYKGYALPYNVSRWVVGHGFPGGFPNSLQVRKGRMRDLAIKGTGRERIPGQNPIYTYSASLGEGLLVMRAADFPHANPYGA